MRKEVDYYKEIAAGLEELLSANFRSNNICIYPLIGEIKTELSKLLTNNEVGENAQGVIKDLAQKIDTLNVDISFFLFNKENEKYELVILEIKKKQAVGLTELSQLIGYCLVSKAKFGILINVDHSTSERFATTLERDRELTAIERKHRAKPMTHFFGVMTWNSSTLSFEYSGVGQISSIPDLAARIEENLV